MSDSESSDDYEQDATSVDDKNSTPRDFWGRLRSEVTFASPSDARLASLYLENAKTFPIALLSKVFDAILDPTFKLEDVTFKNHRDVFEYISETRTRVAATSAGKEVSKPATSTANRRVTRSQAENKPSLSIRFPSVIVGQVVERMVRDQLPLGAAATEPRWENAYRTNVFDFHSLSLVHRSWTCFARRGLSNRAVVPFRQMKNFLLSPLCSPSITELILYWDVQKGREGVTASEMALLGALLKRLPKLHSLAFNTCHVWRKGNLNYWNWNVPNDEPPFRVDECLELIADLLPNLENLWLKHYRGELGIDQIFKHLEPVWVDRTLEFCPEMPSLYRQLPKMKSLKFLSMRRWTCTGVVDWELAPPESLKTVELSVLDKRMSNLKWLLEPRGEFKPTAISIDVRDYALREEDVAAIPPELEKLQIYAKGWYSRPRIFEKCENLRRLDLLVSSSSSSYVSVLERIVFPRSLEYLSIHLDDEDQRGEALVRVLSGSSEFVRIIGKRLEALPLLQTLALTETKCQPGHWLAEGELDGFIYYMDIRATELSEKVPQELSEICEERGVKLIIRHASCTPVCDRNFDYEEPESEPNPDDQFKKDPFSLNPTSSTFGSVFGARNSLTLLSLLAGHSLNKSRF